MKKRLAAAVLAVSAALLAGCGKAALPYAREMGDMACLLYTSPSPRDTR